MHDAGLSEIIGEEGGWEGVEGGRSRLFVVNLEWRAIHKGLVYVRN